jgi:hypothetical protein
VGDLSSLSINSDMLVLDMLKAFDIEIDSSNVLYNILKGKTIGNMSNIKIEDMLLKDVLLPEYNEKLYELLQTLFDINPEQAKVSALGSLSINQNVLKALNYIGKNGLLKAVKFNMNEKDMRMLSTVTEAILCAQLGRRFESLNYFKKMRI